MLIARCNQSLAFASFAIQHSRQLCCIDAIYVDATFIDARSSGLSANRTVDVISSASRGVTHTFEAIIFNLSLPARRLSNNSMSLADQLHQASCCGGSSLSSGKPVF